MKKQLLIAAVAATMGTAAIADVSITGAGMVKFVNVDSGVAGTADTNTTSQEMDLTVTGKTGDTSVVMKFDMDGGTTIAAGDQYLTTTIAGVSVKAGNFEGGKSNMTAKSARADKMSLGYVAGPVTITYENNADNSADAIYLAGSIGGVNGTFKKKDGSDELLLDTTIAGVGIAYRGIQSDTAASDANEVVLTGSVSGFDITYAQADADTSRTLNGDGIYGDINSGALGATGDITTVAGTDLRAVKVSTEIAGNTVSWTNVEADAILAANDADVDTFLITRALAAGTTLNAKYTMKDVGTATTNDSDTMEVKLSVAF